MGTLSANKIATTYKSLVFTDHTSSGVGDIYYTSTGDADVKLTTLTTALTFTGQITAKAGIRLDNDIIYASDGGTTITLDTSDNVAITGDLIVTGNDIKTGTIGSPTTAITMSGANVTIAGDLTITGGNITNAITCDSTLTVAGDLTVSGDDIIIGDSDDATDKSINFRHDTCEVFMGIDDSQESNAGAFIIHTGTGFQATKLDNDFLLDGSGNLHLGNGELRTTGIAFTDGDDCLTIADGGVATFAAGVTVTGNLTFTGGARDIIFPEASGLEIKDADSTYIAMINNAMTVSHPMTCSGKVLLNGNTGPTAGTGITAATGETYNSWVERCGNMIKTSIYIDMNSLQANGDQKVIGKDGGTANCHLGQITTALNGAIVGGRMTCLEEPATGDRDIDLCFDDVATGAEATDLTGETDLVVRGGDWTTSEMRTFGTVVTADNYLYLRTGTNASDNTYSAGKFLIELWGTV